MALNKLEWRAVKEVLLTQYRSKPEEVSFVPCIVTNDWEKTEQDRFEDAKVLHRLPVLEWPFRDTHLITAEPNTREETIAHGLDKLLGDGSSAFATLFSYSERKNKGVERLMSEFTKLVKQTSFRKDSRIILVDFVACGVSGLKCSSGRKTIILESSPVLPSDRMNWEKAISDAENEDDRRLYEITADYLFFDDGHKKYQHRVLLIAEGSIRIDVALTKTLGTAIASVNPISGYHKVTALLPEGFGPKKIRRATKGKKFFCFVPQNPIYSIRDTNGKSGRKLKTGHDRRSHDRHFWSDAGIDRTKLPIDPAERRRMVRDYNIKTIRIKPVWVGPKTFVHEGVTYTKVDDA